MKKVLSIVLCLFLVITLASCGDNREKTKEDDNFNAEEGVKLWTINGRYCETTDGRSLLISETEGTISISSENNEDLFADLENGDEIEILVDGVAETYPAQATVYSCTLIEKGTVEDLDSDEIQNLENLGWKFPFEVKIKDEVSGNSQSTDTDKENENVSFVENNIVSYPSYNSSWTEEIINAINERSQYYSASAFYPEIMDYWENVREVRDISNVMEPLFETDKKYYTAEEFENEPMLVIHLAKNEIYARHGYIFSNKDLFNYFMGCIWYSPTCASSDFDDSVFNEYEKKNLEVLAELDTY
jgi:hypothetical protein